MMRGCGRHGVPRPRHLPSRFQAGGDPQPPPVDRARAQPERDPASAPGWAAASHPPRRVPRRTPGARSVRGRVRGAAGLRSRSGHLPKVGPLRLVARKRASVAGPRWCPGPVVALFGASARTEARSRRLTSGGSGACGRHRRRYRSSTLSADLSSEDLELVLGRARSRHLVRASELDRLRARQPSRRGWARLGKLLEAETHPEFARSRAEVLARSIISKADLGEPRRNARVRGFEVDFWLPDLRLVIEVDGYAFHGGRESFKRDRRRDARLRAAAIEVWRLSWEQLTKRRAETTEDLRRAGEARRRAIGAE